MILFLFTWLSSLNFSIVMPGTEPLLILGGMANARSGHFSNAPPATSFELVTSGNGVIQASMSWYLEYIYTRQYIHVFVMS